MPGLTYPEPVEVTEPEATPAICPARTSGPHGTVEMEPHESPPEDREARPRERRLHGPLPFWLRVVVLLVGWLVLLIGVAGLVLPGIQGVVTILLGAAILSVASETAHRWMRLTLQRWPRVWHRIDGFREKIHDKLHRMVHRG